MNTRRSGLALLMAVLFLLAASSAQADEAAERVLACMRANVPTTLRIQEIELTAFDRSGGSRKLQGKVYALKEDGLTRATLRIVAPSDLRGAAYLVRQGSADHGDEIYFYLPAVKRVRRISGASADSSLLGTDFSYSDMKALQNAFADSGARLEKPETLEQRPMQVLTLLPKAGASSRYSRVRAWIDQKTCIALKVDFFEGETLRKELSVPAAALKQADHYWYAGQVQMSDLKDGTRTLLNVTGVSGDDRLPSGLFDPHTFYIGG